MSRTPTLIGYEADNILRPVSPYNPLPTESKAANIDRLMAGTLTVDTTARDLTGSTIPEIDTLSDAGIYRRFILVFHKTGTAEITITLKGRGANLVGSPLATGWATVGTFSTTGAAAGHYRLVLEAADGKPLGYDIYRIEITSTASQTVSFNLKAER